MVDGNNVDDTAQDEIAAKDAEIAKLKKMNDDAQAQIGKQANEIGEVRKEYAEIKERLDALSSKDAPPDTGNAVTIDDLEKSLNDDQRKLVESVWTGLSPEEKIQYDEDEKFRKAVLSRAKTEIRAVPDSPWKKQPPKREESGLNQRLAQLFENARKSANFVPDGPATGINSATGRGGSATQVGDRKDLDMNLRGILGPYAR